MKRLSFGLGLLVALSGAQSLAPVAYIPYTPPLIPVRTASTAYYAYWGQLSKVQRAVKKHADLRAQGQWSEPVGTVSGTPLHAAVSGAHPRVISFLITQGAEVNSTNAQWKYTPLHVAAGGGFSGVVSRKYAQLVRLLIERGAHVNVQDEFGQTPLHRAAATNNSEAVAILLEKFADPYIEDNHGLIPAEQAVRYKQLAKKLDPEGRMTARRAYRAAKRGAGKVVERIGRVVQ